MIANTVTAAAGLLVGWLTAVAIGVVYGPEVALVVAVVAPGLAVWRAHRRVCPGDEGDC